MRNASEDAPPGTANLPFQFVTRGHTYLVDLRKYPRFGERRMSYWKALPGVADQLGWFGDEPYSPAKTVSREELKNRTLPSIRRVLVSFQVGRPVVDIAARVPCSRRSVYEVLDELFYRWNGNLTTWIGLGLVAVWDGPEIYFDPSWAPSSEQFWKDAAPVFCMLCHRPIDHARMDHRDHDSTLVQPGDGRYKGGRENHAKALGHLISHFYLGGRPEPNEPSAVLDRAYIMFSGFYGKPNANRWRDRVPGRAIYESQKWRSEPPPPVFQGKSPTRESVIQYYRELL